MLYIYLDGCGLFQDDSAPSTVTDLFNEAENDVKSMLVFFAVTKYQYNWTLIRDTGVII